MNPASDASRPTLIQSGKLTTLSRPNSRLAVASFSLALLTGIIWIGEFCLLFFHHIFEWGILLTLLTTPLALLLGFGALWQIWRSTGAVGGKSFAVAGVLITLLAAFVGFVLPTLSRTHCG